MFDPMEARFACGSMVLFSFSQKNSQREFFCEKDQVSSTLCRRLKYLPGQ
jgi:hypothetical protein